MDDKNWETEGDFVKVGDIGVDAGLVWIGDPCYIQDDSKHNPLKDWECQIRLEVPLQVGQRHWPVR